MKAATMLVLGLLGGGGGLTQAQIFDAYSASLAPLLDLRMNITSGTTVPNQGSLGTGQNGTLTLGVGALSQSSPLGAGEAILWDALDTRITIPNSASVEGIPIQTWVFLCKPNSAGENASAKLFSYNNTANEASNINVSQSVSASVRAATTSASATASGSSFLTFNAWNMIFIEYDDTGDRKIHLYNGISGAVAEAGYASQVAAVGALTTTSGTLHIGNRLLLDNTWDGLFSRVLYFNRLLTGAEKLGLVTRAGV